MLCEKRLHLPSSVCKLIARMTIHLDSMLIASYDHGDDGWFFIDNDAAVIE